MKENNLSFRIWTEILHSIQSEPVYCLNYRFELSQMMDQIEQIKAENAARFTYLESLMIEKKLS
jgi:hypothetical protein